MPRLEELVTELSPVEFRAPLDAAVAAVAYDSRQVKPGTLFVAIRGASADGHDYIEKALVAGAVAVVVDNPAKAPASAPVIVVKDSRRALSRLAHVFFAKPSEHLTVLGITGTNGKTTVTYLLEAIFRAEGLNTGVTGTVNVRYGDVLVSAPMTTPESIDYQATLAAMRASGVSNVVSEVSSHALEQHRMDDIAFDVAIFTNLTRDHLDYHRDMENYFAAKARLFRDLLPASGKRRKTAVINLDDPFGKRLADEIGPLKLTYSLRDPAADFLALDVTVSRGGLRSHIKTPVGKMTLESPLLGWHNLSNLLAALAGAHALGLPIDRALHALAGFQAVPGRLQPVGNNAGKTVLVDYAHTPDALENVLSALRPLVGPGGRLVCLFGCGGDRDRGKRPIMGELAARLADRFFVTSDNPRTEVPEKIVADIVAGVPRERQSRLHVEVDRRQAIAAAVASLSNSDILVIAGKGHEDYQIIGREKFPFDDVAVAAAALQRGDGS